MVTQATKSVRGFEIDLNWSKNNSGIKVEQSKWYLQFLMSEMKTANPRIPSPFDTAGILQDYVLALTLPLKKLRRLYFPPFLHKTEVNEGQLNVW